MSDLNDLMVVLNLLFPQCQVLQSCLHSTLKTFSVFSCFKYAGREETVLQHWLKFWLTRYWRMSFLCFNNAFSSGLFCRCSSLFSHLFPARDSILLLSAKQEWKRFISENQEHEFGQGVSCFCGASLLHSTGACDGQKLLCGALTYSIWSTACKICD